MSTEAPTPASGKSRRDVMSFEMTVALLVQDQEMYAQYRREIRPLLENAGAAFRYDFAVSGVLKSEAAHDINRVFILRFPDRTAKEGFFADPVYREIRARLFEKAVKTSTVVAESA